MTSDIGRPPLRDNALRPKTAPQGGRRLDVQGLRAVAVGAVLIYHAGLPMSGGFVGVDVFFVISGFVITAMLLREHAELGRIRFKRFYTRRFKRLIPALSVTVAITIAISALLLSPFGPQEVAAKTGIGASLLAANFAIVVTGGGGYFGTAAELNPLLHTWSLSIEEQFYLVFPAVLIAAIAWGRRRGGSSNSQSGHRAGILAVILLSVISGLFVVANVLEVDFRGAAVLFGFYSPFARVWEFGAGALLALVPHADWIRTQRVAAAVGGAGLLMLLAAFFLIDGSSVWPGPLTLLPVVGTMLVIVSGSARLSITNGVTQFLSTKPMAKIGDLSYSLYLWHWPLIVFAHALWPQQLWVGVIAAGVSVVPALLSYHLVEEPIRHANGLVGKRLLQAIGLAVLGPVLVAATVQIAGGYHWGSEQLEAFAAEVEPQHIGKRNGCDSRAPLGGQRPGCSWNLQGEGSPLYLVGDSNMDHFLEGWIEAGRVEGRPMFTATTNACPFLDIVVINSDMTKRLDDACRDYVQDSLAWLEEAPIGTVVISNSDYYLFKHQFAMGLWDDKLASDYEGKLNALKIGLNVTVEKVQALGHRVIVVQGVPLWIESDSWDPSTCTTLSVVSGDCTATMTVAEASARQGDIRDGVGVISRETGATVWDSWSELCSGGVCSTHDGAVLRYRDDEHITVGQAERLAPIFAELLSDDG